MGFYGNITNTNRTQFVFDRVFANRAEMDGYVTELEAEDGLKYWSDICSDEEAQQNVEKDSVFVGRYVLVDYDKEVSNKLPYRRVYKEKGTYCDYFYFDSSLSIKTIVKCFSEQDNSGNKIIKEENYYITDDYGNTMVNPLVQEEGYSSYIFSDEIVYVYENNEYTYYKLKSTGSRALSHFKENELIQNVAPLVEIIELTKDEKEEINNLFDYYYNNSNIDRRVYNNTGRGWDSTVWQKTYSDGKSKYVMIAELNSVVPSFAVSIDPPTLLPMAPHFGSDSTNVFYRLHAQPNWGFRIKKAEDNQNSDYQVKLQGNNWIYDEEAKVWKWVKDYDLNYPGAIYYNKDGFDSQYRTAKEDSEDIISLAPTGISGQKYNTHDGTEKAEQADIQELTVNLPSIGNAVSKMWDLVYGEGEETTEENVYFRNQNIDWNSHAGLRLVREKDDGTGYEYDTKKVETLAGCINSVHDLMGMIVLTADSWTDPNEALEDYIYYKRDADSNEYGYFIKDLTYTFTDEEGDSVQELVELKDFSKKDYYALQEGSYYFANAYRNGGKYYTFTNNPVEVPLASKDYKKETYYIKEGNSYYLDASDKPTDGKDYYYIPKMNNGNQEAVNNVKTYFFPETEEYYNKFINSKKPSEDINYGLFYLGENERFYPFKLNETTYKQYLYWWVGYQFKDEVEEDGTPTRVYDTSVGTRAQYEMKQFIKDTYFCQEEESSDYLFLNSENDIDLDKTYYSFPENIAPTQIAGNINGIMTNFYVPNRYFYLEGKNYIYAKEESKLKNIYYTISFENDVETITDLFYEPNKYYYYVDGEYILDTSPGWTEGRVYYNSYEKYVKEDTVGVFNVGAKWPLNITKPESVTLGIRRPKWQWKKLEGFSRSLNTINGLIIKINQILKFDDELTRDTKTVQGCINTLNDIIKKFNNLIPGNIMIVNRYGQIVSAGPVEGEWGDDWIAVSVDPIAETISWEHTVPVAGTAEAVAAVTPKFGESFEITDHYFDEKGHKFATKTHTVTIPTGSHENKNEINGQTVFTDFAFIPESGAITTKSSNLGDVLIAENETLSKHLETLQTNINNEATARGNADAALESKISEEASQREAADNALSGRITSLESNVGTWNKAEENVQADWAETDTASDSFIQNKPDLSIYLESASLSNSVKSNVKFSYDSSEMTMTIQDIFDALATRIKTLEDALANSESGSTE